MVKDNTRAITLRASHEVLQLIAEIDELKGRWTSPDSV
jgi:phage tail sheath protein FI